MRVLSLFSGGGLGDYGLTLAGMEIVGQVEIDPYCQKLLELRWPNVAKHRDIETFSLPADFLVKTFPLQTKKPKAYKKETILGFGQNSSESFLWYDQNTQSWRTYQQSFFEGWDEFLETWPQSGTMQNGKCYQAECLEPATYGDESGLLPTPQASDWKRDGRPHGFDQIDLPRFLNGKPNPIFVEWMMGLPIGFTDLEYLETAKTLALQNGSEKELC